MGNTTHAYYTTTLLTTKMYDIFSFVKYGASASTIGYDALCLLPCLVDADDVQVNRVSAYSVVVALAMLCAENASESAKEHLEKAATNQTYKKIPYANNLNLDVYYCVIFNKIKIALKALRESRVPLAYTFLSVSARRLYGERLDIFDDRTHSYEDAILMKQRFDPSAPAFSRALPFDDTSE